MTTITVEAKSNAKLFQVTLDNQPLTFEDGLVKPQIAEGVNHALQWFVRGDQGNQYSIAVTAPLEAEFTHQGTLDDEGKDAGLHWVKV